MSSDLRREQAFQAKIESYREANQYGRSIYDNFYRHAAIFFTFNAVLITAAGFLFDSDFTGVIDCRGIFIVNLAVLGFLYNFGAVCAYRRTMQIFLNLIAFIHNEETSWHGFLPVQQQINPGLINGDQPRFRDRLVYYLSNVFFTILMLAWLSVIVITVLEERTAMWECLKKIG